MEIKLSSTAKQQLKASAEFYQRQLDGLGDYFLDSVMADIDSLRIHAGVHRMFFDRYHRMPTNRFPYSVYYRVEGDIINVYAVIDDRMNPVWIAKQFIET